MKTSTAPVRRFFFSCRALRLNIRSFSFVTSGRLLAQSKRWIKRGLYESWPCICSNNRCEETAMMKRQCRAGIIAQRQTDYGVKRTKSSIILKTDVNSEQRWMKPDDSGPLITDKIKVVYENNAFGTTTSDGAAACEHSSRWHLRLEKWHRNSYLSVATSTNGNEATLSGSRRRLQHKITQVDNPDKSGFKHRHIGINGMICWLLGPD